MGKRLDKINENFFELTFLLGFILMVLSLGLKYFEFDGILCVLFFVLGAIFMSWLMWLSIFIEIADFIKGYN